MGLREGAVSWVGEEHGARDVHLRAGEFVSGAPRTRAAGHVISARGGTRGRTPPTGGDSRAPYPVWSFPVPGRYHPVLLKSASRHACTMLAPNVVWNHWASRRRSTGVRRYFGAPRSACARRVSDWLPPTSQADSPPQATKASAPRSRRGARTASPRRRRSPR